MIEQLQQIGFTRNEAIVYMALLSTADASVQELARSTGLNRITVHSIIEKFEREKIVRESYEGKRRRLHVVDPSELHTLLSREAEEVVHKKQTLDGILPHLIEQYRQSNRGLEVKTYKGEKGYEEMCEDILRERKPMLEYANIDALNEAIGPYIAKDYLPRKHQLQIPTKFLFIDTKGAHEYIEKNYTSNPNAAPMEVKFLSKQQFDMDSFFVIYGDKLAIFTPASKDGVIIRDTHIANAMRPFFQFVWEGA